MTEILVTVRGDQIRLDVDEDPPLGWRFWTFAGFPGDPVEPRPYGGSRGIPMAYDDELKGWIVAMELDDTFQLFTPHELFPCAHQDGAADFGRRIIQAHAKQPSLL